MIMAVINVYVLFKTQRSYDLSKITIESLANESSSGEEGGLPDDAVVGKVMKQVYVPGNFSFGAGIDVSDKVSASLSFNKEWVSMYCCVNSNEYTACRKTTENQDCRNVNLTGIRG